MKAKIGKSYLTEIPHEGNCMDFQHPAFKGTYANVAEQIKKEGLALSTSGQTASLVYDAFQDKKGKYESEIIKILKDNWLWEFTGNLYLPKSGDKINNGVILEDNPTIQDGRLIMNKSSLIKRLNENDPSVRFVPFGYETGEQSALKLSKNKYIIARYGEEGADKIAEISSQYNKHPKLWAFDFVSEEKVRLSALYYSCGGGHRLNVNGVDCDDDGGGRSFGVQAERRE